MADENYLYQIHQRSNRQKHSVGISKYDKFESDKITEAIMNSDGFTLFLVDYINNNVQLSPRGDVTLDDLINTPEVFTTALAKWCGLYVDMKCIEDIRRRVEYMADNNDFWEGIKLDCLRFKAESPFENYEGENLNN